MLLRKIIWIMTILLMAMIFFFSSRPGEISRQDSAWFLDKTNIADQEEALDTSNMQAMNLQTWIRKTAHVIIFATLAMFIYASIYGYIYKAIGTGILSWILSIIFAITDEIHQYFVPGRGAQIQDVIRDSKGSFLGCIIMMVLILIIEKLPVLYKLINKIYNLNVNRIFLKTVNNE